MAIGAGRIWPGKVSYKAIDQGNTRGGIAAVVSSSWKDEKVDQFGDGIVNRHGAGVSKVGVDLSMAEMTAARMAAATGETAVSGVVKIKATTNIGSNMLATSGALKVFPIIGGVASATAQVHLPLAYPQFDISLPFSESPQAIKVSYGGFPDESDSNTVAIFSEV